jgi:hypothetical protein
VCTLVFDCINSRALDDNSLPSTTTIHQSRHTAGCRRPACVKLRAASQTIEVSMRSEWSSYRRHPLNPVPAYLVGEVFLLLLGELHLQIPWLGRYQMLWILQVSLRISESSIEAVSTSQVDRAHIEGHVSKNRLSNAREQRHETILYLTSESS